MARKKFNSVALSIIFLSIILVLIFVDKILINLTAVFVVIGIPIYYYFINHPQQCIALLIFFPSLFYINHLSNKNKKLRDDEYREAYPNFEAENNIDELNAWYQDDLSTTAKQHLNYLFLLFALTVPVSFLLAIFFDLKKFSLAVLSMDFLFTGWMGLCIAIIFGYGYRLSGVSNKKALQYCLGFLLFFTFGFILIAMLDSYILRPNLKTS